MQNTLIIKESWISRKLLNGWHLFDYTKYDIAGSMSIFYIVSYHTTLFADYLLSICLNLDVVATIRQPYNRVHNLKYLLWLMRLGFVAIFSVGIYAIMLCFDLTETVNYICLDPYDYKGLLKAKASFYIELKTWFTNINLYITLIYAIISFSTLLITLISYIRSIYSDVKMSKDVRK